MNATITDRSIDIDSLSEGGSPLPLNHVEHRSHSAKNDSQRHAHSLNGGCTI